MKRAFFLIILLHYGISNAAQPSAPSASWLTEADIMEVQSLGNIPAAKPSAEELAQLRWQAERYQESLRNTAAMQEGQKHRGAWTAPVPDPAAACAAPAKPPRQKGLTHKRNRSNSEPTDVVSPMSPPPFAHFTTGVDDATLKLALQALQHMEENANSLFQGAKEELLEAQRNHKQLLENPIDPTLPEPTGLGKVLALVQKRETRLKNHLNRQTAEHTKLQGEATQALNILVAAILNAENVLKELGKRVEHKSGKTAARQEELRQRANSTSGSPRLSTGTKRT
ncbi:MAG: hypothetical protein EBU90_05235 [Proteobacteria bacterium]|nr:hypothetical protein [Pseudomonadota bacterium]NBP15991.1 hypothetical protein [bacterium]